MTRSMVAGVHWGEIKTLITRDKALCRRLFLYILPSVAAPIMVVLLQVGVIILMSQQSAEGRVLATLIADPLKKAIPSSLGMFVILGTAMPLSALLLGRDRYGGALEGVLSTPVSTASVWLSRTITVWIPGVVLFFIMAGIAVLTNQVCLSDVAAYGAEDYSAWLWMIPLLLVVTLLAAAAIVLLLLGGTRRVMLICVGVQTLLTVAVVLWLSFGMVQGRFVDYRTVTQLEMIAIPALAIAMGVLGRYLLNRQRIVGKYK